MPLHTEKYIYKYTKFARGLPPIYGFHESRNRSHTPALAGENGVLRVVDRAEAMPTGTIIRLAHPMKVGPGHTVSGERLRRGE